VRTRSPASGEVLPTPPPGRTRRLVTAAVMIVVLTVADLAVKEWVQTAVADDPIRWGGLQLRLGFNPGVAFSLGENAPEGAVTAVTAVLVIVLVVVLTLSTRHHRPGEQAGLALLVGGALGNVLDRAGDGLVTDYLHTGWWPTFNLADVWICLGVAVLLVSQFWPAARVPKTTDVAQQH
jgi:signal peptidase II